VHCDCGTTDDDGERMVACERCNQWRHTRCLGVCSGAWVPATPLICLRSVSSCRQGYRMWYQLRNQLALLPPCPFREDPFCSSSHLRLVWLRRRAVHSY